MYCWIDWHWQSITEPCSPMKIYVHQCNSWTYLSCAVLYFQGATRCHEYWFSSDVCLDCWPCSRYDTIDVDFSYPIWMERITGRLHLYQCHTCLRFVCHVHVSSMLWLFVCVCGCGCVFILNMDEFWRFLNDDNHLCIICLVAAIVFNWNEPEIWKWPASYHDLETNEVHMHGLS